MLLRPRWLRVLRLGQCFELVNETLYPNHVATAEDDQVLTLFSREFFEESDDLVRIYGSQVPYLFTRISFSTDLGNEQVRHFSHDDNPLKWHSRHEPGEL